MSDLGISLDQESILAHIFVDFLHHIYFDSSLKCLLFSVFDFHNIQNKDKHELLQKWNDLHCLLLFM